MVPAHKIIKLLILSSYVDNLNKIKKYLPVITGIICLVAIWTLEPFRHFLFFKDYGITWEGAYRIYRGQIPFNDFSSPIGPISFLIPSMFFLALGPSWHSFEIAQLAQNSVFLLTAFYILRKLGCRPIQISISLLLFTLFYLIFLSHPWYNSTATLFFFLTLAATLAQNHYAFFWAGVLSGLAFLTKQDTGVLSIISVGFIALFSQKNEYLLSKRSTNLLKSITGAALVLLIFYLLIGASNFNAWIMNSFDLALQRGNGINDFLSGVPLLLLGILCFGRFLISKERVLLYAAVIFGSSFANIQTKALFFTTFYFTLFLYISIDCFARRIKGRGIYLLALMSTFALSSLYRPAVSLINLGETTILEMPEPFSFNRLSVTKPLISSPSDMQVLKDIWAPMETFEVISEVRRLADEIHSKTGHPSLILNISELTPIYGELNIDPPKNIPLWFDPEISISKEEANFIYQKIHQNEFDIVIFQSSFGGMGKNFYNKTYGLLRQNSNYKSVKDDGFFSPSSSISECASRQNCLDHNIFIFVKNSN